MRRLLLVVLCSVACAKQAPRSDHADFAAAPQQEEPARASAAPAATPEVADEEAPNMAASSPAAGIQLEMDASIEELEAALDGYEAELRDHGVRLRGYKKSDTTALRRRDVTSKSAVAPGPKCQRVCEIAEAVCGLRTRICSMAQTHADEPKYGVACRRAERDCERASAACDECGA